MARTRTAPQPPRPTVREHPADRAVRQRDRTALPAELHPAYDAVLLAFARYEAGDDDAARAALQGVGLQSPFLEWKVLLRGLFAYTAGDGGRALENWQRLSADRLPARLAAPLRAALDPAFKRSQSPAAAADLERQLEALTSDGLLAGLRQLRADLSRDRSLTAAFRRAEQLLPMIRKQAPHLVGHLANCLYRSILTHGEPADLPRFRKLFGPPADDPEFHRLEALAREDGKDDEAANRHWAAYEAWLGSNPPGWPADLARRARAMILHRMAAHAADLADDPHRELREMMSSFFGRSRARRKPAPPPDPTPLWRRAVELAPDWEAPTRALFERLVVLGRGDEAERAALKLLEHNPTALGAMGALAGRFAQAGRAAEALDLRAKALAANPLDKALRVQAAYAHVAAARRLAIDGQLADAERTLDAGRALCEENTPAGYFALRSVVARKAGRADEADALRDRALAVPNGRLAAAFFLAVDAGLLKLKPAAKRPADQDLAAALAGPATAIEASLLYAAWDMYFLEGITYRGQKAQEKKVHALILRTPASDGPALDFEVLARGVSFRNEWKLAEKLAGLLREKFPDDPVFPLLLAEVEFAKADGMPRPNRVARHLRDAARLAERSSEARHRDLLDLIRRLQEEAVHPAYFDDFF
ncbi:MAG TPA: hypothetical protein VFG68_00210 [Fimbriiglobus sp.]|nr:hypothetical protein [Fimbriiglobus sp.]